MSTNQEDTSPGTESASTSISTAEGRSSAVFRAVVPGPRAVLGMQETLRYSRGELRPGVRPAGSAAFFLPRHPWGTRSAAACSEGGQCFSALLLPFLCYLANVTDKEIGGEGMGMNTALRKEVELKNGVRVQPQLCSLWSVITFPFFVVHPAIFFLGLSSGWIFFISVNG